MKIVKELEGPRGGRAWLSGHPPSPRLRGRAEEWCPLNAYYNISVYIGKRYSYLPERQGDTESGDGAAASGGPSICLHDPYRVCGLSARPLPGLRIVCTALPRPALGGRADEAPRSEAGDDPQGAADGHQILEQGDDKVRRAQRFDQACSHLVAAEGAHNRAQSS